MSAEFVSGFVVVNGLQIIHLCHNRKCVNPGHLAIGTLEANIYSG